MKFIVLMKESCKVKFWYLRGSNPLLGIDKVLRLVTKLDQTLLNLCMGRVLCLRVALKSVRIQNKTKPFK